MGHLSSFEGEGEAEWRKWNDVSMEHGFEERLEGRGHTNWFPKKHTDSDIGEPDEFLPAIAQL